MRLRRPGRRRDGGSRGAGAGAGGTTAAPGRRSGLDEIGHAATGPAMAYAEVARASGATRRARSGRSSARATSGSGRCWPASPTTAAIGSAARSCSPWSGRRALCSRTARTCCGRTASRASSSTTTCWRRASRSPALPGRTGRTTTPSWTRRAWPTPCAKRRSRRGAALGEVGTVGGIASDAGGIEVEGTRGAFGRSRRCSRGMPSCTLAGVTVTTVRGEQVEADVQPGAPLPSPARTEDGRFAWQVSEATLRLHARAARGVEVDAVLGQLPLRAPVRRERAASRPRTDCPSSVRDPANLLIACGPVGWAWP